MLARQEARVLVGVFKSGWADNVRQFKEAFDDREPGPVGKYERFRCGD